MSRRFLPDDGYAEGRGASPFVGKTRQSAPMERRLAELTEEDNRLVRQELLEAKVRLHRKLIDDLNLAV
ncbi:MAG: hypothetical protein P8Y36_03020, partial [Alphaproteobacteria bacterium]